MSISSSMYAAVTGLSALSTGMQTISNNIANVNTVGFKAGRTNYEDLISQNYFSGGRVNQVGSGVKVSSVQSMFTQGSFMSSAQDTDMAIAGEGFFSVRNAVTGAINYTRAGNFTLNKNGYLEDPSGNILQGWQMSVPAPGESAVRIGAPVDVKITVLNAPPMETSQVKVVVNLNADDKTAYKYDEYELAEVYAKEQAEPVAASARAAAAEAVWNSGCTVATLSGAVPTGLNGATDQNGAAHTLYNDYFLKTYNETYGVTIAGLNDLTVVADGTSIDQAGRAAGQMTLTEFNSLVTITESECLAEAAARGQDAYSLTYKNVYESTYEAIKSRLADWQLEGNGFAGAWDANDNPPISTDSYTYSEAVTIYDSLGAEHKLMIYYQPNPHMENVWDYIVTCDPLEDARKDADNSLLFSDSSTFSGLIQKGKITFSADGDDRHGGVIKDLEAQNLDLANSKMAKVDAPEYAAGATAVTRGATIGGYYSGSPDINPFTGQYESSEREYTITWGREDPAGSGNWTGNVSSDPPTSGFTWTDSLGNTGYVAINDSNYAGPYEFGSGLTITFDDTLKPLRFGEPGQDSLSLTAHSEQISWTNQTPNKEGYFEFDLAFVQSASMALHPPYPSGLPTVTQTVSFDMGAKNPYGLSNTWTLDDSSTTQYATNSSTVFNSQDGFPPGSLQRISIGEDGVVTGVYSNGRNQALYQVALTKFLNPWGLSKQGDNLYASTIHSGEGVTNEPGYGGTGTVLANFLEQSNVDLAEEIVNMIVTQRGFQANSKTITTTDSMMSEIIEMKR